jgi:uncharacterized protein (DUF2132 family)
MIHSQRNQDPLHGITLKNLLSEMVDYYGWAKLAQKISINCFAKNPSLNSSLKFLRKTPWARNKVEQLYIQYTQETLLSPPYQPKIKNMLLNTFLNTVTANKKVSFTETQAVISEFYHYTATTFSNGIAQQAVINKAGSNEGSCKIFAFAQLNQLTAMQTLNLFGDYYHDEVLNDPEGTSHQNIRNFMIFGWEGIQFTTNETLRLK